MFKLLRNVYFNPKPMRTYAFEKLEVWQKAKDLVVLIYRVTAALPQIERFGLSSQIQRAAVSVASNLAEGCSRQSGKEQARYTEMSFSSLMELLNQLIIMLELGYINSEKLTEFRVMIDEIAAKLQRLRMAQLKRN